MKNQSKYYKKISLFFIIILSFWFTACEKHFEKVNTPSNLIVADNIDVNLLGQAFAQAQYNSYLPGVWFATYQTANIYSQLFSNTTSLFLADQFVPAGSWNDDIWNGFYSGPATQLYFVEEYTAKNLMPVENAIAKISRVLLYHRLTDYFGPIIYSEFGNGKTSVKYDSQKDIYHDFFKTLDEAVAVLAQNPNALVFVADDQMYNGVASKWSVFANSLRLRLAMRISYIEPTLAKSEAEKAVAAGVINTNADNANVLSTPDSRNWLMTKTNVEEFRMSASMQSTMTGYDDPRLPFYFDEASVGGGYKGVRNGLPTTDLGNYLNLENSRVDNKWLPLAKGGTNPPSGVMSAAEVYFLRAEGALRGWNMGGTAQDLYNNGIRSSLTQWTTASPIQIEAYVTSTAKPVAINDKWNTPPMSDIPVLYQSAGSFETQLEQIITQKWLALYPDGWEAWSERRRTGYPRGYEVINSLNPDVPKDKLMRRLTFAPAEFSNNVKAVAEAKTLLGGPDNTSTRLWWDAKPLTDYPKPTH